MVAAVLAIACVAMLAGCPARARVWVLDGSSAANLQFGLEGHRRRHPAKLRQFEVVECSERARTVRRAPGTRWQDDEVAVWAIRTSGPGEIARQLAYGRLPSEGFAEVAPAKPLRPGGCYLAKLEANPGTGSTIFRVREGGAVIELSRGDKAALYDSWSAEAKACENDARTEIFAPSGQSSAVVFQRDCGVTIGVSILVSLFTGDRSFGSSRNVFVADTEYGQVPGDHGGGPISVGWRGPDTLVVWHDFRARVFRADTLHAGVTVRYVRDSLQ